jgi:hypothetical protein
MTRRLYRVEATYTYFVVADDEYDALDSSVLSDAVHDAIDPDEHTAVLDDGKTTPGNWRGECNVYTTDDEDMTLAEARERLRGGGSDG